METKKLIDLLTTQSDVVLFNYFFYEHVDGIWTKGTIVLLQKEDISLSMRNFRSIVRVIRDRSLFQLFGYKIINQWISALGENGESFEPFRLVYSKEIGYKNSTTQIIFNDDLTLKRNNQLKDEEKTEPIVRELSIYFFTSKKRAEDFLPEGKDLINDKTCL